MKKTLEYLYIFSKFSTSFILLSLILILGYFFYLSFKNQGEPTNEQVELITKLNQNIQNLSKISKRIQMIDASIIKIEKAIQNKTNKNSSKEITSLNKKITELDLSLENILIDLQKAKTLSTLEPKNIQLDVNSNIILNKNKTEIVKLVIYKFENRLDFTEELDLLQSLNDESKLHVFEKINLIKLDNFRGSNFLKKIYSQELSFFLKENFNKKSNNFFSKSLMRFLIIEPSKTNTIQNNDINILKEISVLLNQKNYKISQKKIININNHEKYFVETINQIQIAIEFKKLISMIS